MPDQGFKPKDLRLIQSQHTVQRVKEVLDRTGYHWNIILYETYPLPGEDGVASEGRYEALIIEYCELNDVPIAGHITFGKNGSTGEPLTPWMIIHTIGHALMHNFYEVEHPDRSAMVAAINKTFAMGYARTKVRPLKATIFNWGNPDFLKLFGFKSAQRAITDPDHKLSVKEDSEFIYEIVADYLWTGGNLRVTDRQLKADLEAVIKSALDKRVGSIIVDYYV